MTTRLTVCSVAALALVPVLGFAQSYPTRPVRLIATLAPGSAVDILARLVGDPMSRTLGQTVIVDNRPGAGGLVATETVQRAAPDGYTLLIGGASHVINPVLQPKIAYDPIKDFAPVINLASSPNVLIVSNALPVNSVKELVALARKRPGELLFSSGGTGTSQHMAAELFGLLAGVKIGHVPFKGGPQGVQAVLAGEVAMMFPNIPNAIGLAKAGKVRMLAVTTPKRLSWWPELPTIDESGVKGYEVIAWFGVFAPAGTPEAIVERLNAEANKAIALPAVREALVAQGYEVIGGSSREFAGFVRNELDKWTKVVKATGAKAE
ncbi:MAG: tripartite tricarboxylate transporter substrate binding protein [Proteobacteria bacterium]|nr:tripartite tricarboxylate transporter substrate binding protein [Burkholderiales bacterium]